MNNFQTDLLTTITNLAYMAVFLFGVIFYFFNIQKAEADVKVHLTEEEMYQQVLRRKKRALKKGPFSDYYNLMVEFFEKKDPETAEPQARAILIGTGFITLILSFFTGPLIGVLLFVGGHSMFSIFIKSKAEGKSVEYEYKLPEVLDMLVRGFSKHDELQAIIYETSRDIDEPFASMFSEIARKMTSSGHVSVLQEYNAKSESVWIHSLFTILIRYKEDARKEDTVKNLKHLRDMVEQDNKLRRSLISEKRYSVVLNFIISGVSVLGNIVLFIAFPDIAFPAYIQNPIGTMFLIAGYAMVFAVFALTKKLGKRNEMKVGGK